jgi:pyruvate/2-oxoglutarate dehydrogenase complex dihydrolipoamide acyltransferase (E2) component
MHNTRTSNPSRFMSLLGSYLVDMLGSLPACAGSQCTQQVCFRDSAPSVHHTGLYADQCRTTRLAPPGKCHPVSSHCSSSSRHDTAPLGATPVAAPTAGAPTAAAASPAAPTPASSSGAAAPSSPEAPTSCWTPRGRLPAAAAVRDAADADGWPPSTSPTHGWR